MRTVLSSPARRGNKRAAAAALLAWLALVLIVAATLGAASLRSAAAAEPAPGAASPLFPPRVEHDKQRGLIWAIGAQSVSLYDGRSRTLIKKVELPGWAYVDEPQSCAPDLVIDAQGHALVSSNVRPDLWRINPHDQSVEHMAIELTTDGDKEVGFTGLFLVNPYTVLAVSAIQGTLWWIDLESRTAGKLGLARPIRGACALGVQPASASTVTPALVLCATTRNAVHQIRVTNLNQATLLAQPCTLALQPSMENPK